MLLPSQSTVLMLKASIYIYIMLFIPLGEKFISSWGKISFTKGWNVLLWYKLFYSGPPMATRVYLTPLSGEEGRSVPLTSGTFLWVQKRPQLSIHASSGLKLSLIRKKDTSGWVSLCLLMTYKSFYVLWKNLGFFWPRRIFLNPAERLWDIC